MSHTIVDVATISSGHGPHPAASPYDKRVSEALGVRAFEVYQVELPAGAETVRHDHVDDRNEDVYAVISGSGWVVVDDVPTRVGPGHFISVDIESTRFLRAGDDGLVFIAVCAEPRRAARASKFPN
ncbi:cupin [Actinomycetes bacterium M1A6_2h]